MFETFLVHPPKRPRWKPALLAAAAPFLMLSAAKAQFVWDPALNKTGSDGAGLWNTTTPIWALGGADTVWVNSASSTATFGSNTGAAGAVSVANGITAGAITFNPSASGSYTLSGGTLNLTSATPTITTNASATLTAILSTGGASLVKAGSGTLTLDSVSSNAALILVTAGTLATTSQGATAFGNGNSVISVSNGASVQVPAGAVSNSIIFNGGSSDVANISGATLSGTMLLTSGANGFTASTAATISGAISGGGSVVKNGSQKLTLTGNNIYSGGTTINNGSVTMGNGGSSGTLGSGNVVNNGAVSFNRSDAYTVPNNISGVGSVTKVAAGTATLTGASTFTGTTTVSAGKLLLNGSITGATGASNSQIIVASGAKLGGTGTMTGATAGAVTLLGGGQFSPADFDSAGTFTTTSVSWTSDNVMPGMVFNLGATVGAPSDFLSVTGAFTRASTAASYIFDFEGTGVLGQSYTLISFGTALTGAAASVSNLVATDLANGYTGSFALSGNNIVMTVVPEPSTNAICLLSGGALLCMIIRRRHRQSC